MLETDKHSDKTLKDGLLEVKSKMTGRRPKSGPDMEIQLESTASSESTGSNIYSD